MHICGAICRRVESITQDLKKKDVEENEIKCTLTSLQKEAGSEITVRLLTGDCNHLPTA